MKNFRSTLFAFAALFGSAVVAAQEAAVLHKHAAGQPVAKVAMRHGGLHRLPAVVNQAAAVPASYRKVQSARSLPVHFRH
jgi:hypothetical protein